MASGKGIPEDGAELMSLVLESILYGFSVLMFIGTIWALTYKRHMRDVNHPITAVAVLLLVLSTVHMVVGTIRTEERLVQHNKFPGVPVVFFSRETFMIHNMIYVLQTLLGDGVVIYRCYVVWRTVWVIILPSMLWCGIAVTGVYSIHNYLDTTGISGHDFNYATRKWTVMFYTLTLATNLLSSGLLAYRIWKIERNVASIRAMKTTTTSILRVVVDTAILYSIALFCTLIVAVRSNNGSHVMINMLTPIISIIFYIVIIRIAMSKDTHDHILTVCHGSGSETDGGNLQHYPLKPLQVHISQFTHSDAASVRRNGNLDRPSTGKSGIVEGASCNI
ncbi:uncharacterized protein EDB93DRAFT_530025 [Suillus bovinus]|uniref:uncharacterized protein n=1 Tax=Suillus bovinus TaxID=48563 RepID=UPI001B866355|nr:uncharacterized protein EDB93DRAFT_530025 [Suillus bovinus]KAG2144678.1 hypothetical protein EDB93DRAFT_530025 [Suillus bovinus]